MRTISRREALGNLSMHDPVATTWRTWKRPGEVWLPESGTAHISVIRMA